MQIKTIHNCIDYFEDNGIAGTKESSEFFFLFPLSTTCCWSLSEFQSPSDSRSFSTNQYTIVYVS